MDWSISMNDDIERGHVYLTVGTDSYTGNVLSSLTSDNVSLTYQFIHTAAFACSTGSAVAQAAATARGSSLK